MLFPNLQKQSRASFLYSCDGFGQFLSSSVLDVCEVAPSCVLFWCFCRVRQVLIFTCLTDSFVIIHRLNARCDLSLNSRPIYIVIEE